MYLRVLLLVRLSVLLELVEIFVQITVGQLVEVLIVREAVQILVHQVVEVIVLETAMVSAKDVGLDVQTPVQVTVLVDVMDVGLDVRIPVLVTVKKVVKVLVKHLVPLFVLALALLIIVVVPVQVLIVVQMGAQSLVELISVVTVKLELALASVQVFRAEEALVQQLVQLEIFQRLTLFQNKKLNN